LGSHTRVQPQPLARPACPSLWHRAPERTMAIGVDPAMKEKEYAENSSADEYSAKPSGSFEGAISTMIKTRDDDGTVDRVADPPQRMWAVLACFKYKCEVENINLETIFEEGGGTHFGTMKTHKFFSSLKDNFGRFHITEEIIEDIEDHYGCGYEDPRGRHENVAWKDFCEDVGRSKPFDDSLGVAEVMAMTRGAEISYKALKDEDDVYGDELQKLAAADDGYHGHYHLTDKQELMKQSKAEAELAKSMGIDILMMQGDGGLFEKSRVLQHADDCVK